MERITWATLPRAVQNTILERTGPLISAREVASGRSGAMTAVVTTGRCGLFIKAMGSDHRLSITQERAIAVAPLVAGICPALVWHFDEHGWIVLAYENKAERHADYSPGSPHLDKVVDALAALADVEVTDPDLPFKRAEDRMRPYVEEPADAEVFRGTTLTHTDLMPDNVLIGLDQAWLIDWAWPTVGAAWTDPALWVHRLIACGGHRPEQAEEQARRLPAFAAADPAHIDLYADATNRLWQEIAENDPSRWAAGMARGAAAWSEHRATLRPTIV